jgi:predicted tellurium resistance membrane protein TerC
VLRVILIAFALTLLQVPYLKLVGAALLIWIGVKLLAPQDEDGHSNIRAATSCGRRSRPSSLPTW